MLALYCGIRSPPGSRRDPATMKFTVDASRDNLMLYLR